MKEKKNEKKNSLIAHHRSWPGFLWFFLSGLVRPLFALNDDRF